MAKYYTLAIRTEGRWTPQFGDPSKEVVKQEERNSYRFDCHGKAIPAFDRKIICTEPDCDAIDAGVRSLNKYDSHIPFNIALILFGAS